MTRMKCGRISLYRGGTATATRALYLATATFLPASSPAWARFDGRGHDDDGTVRRVDDGGRVLDLGPLEPLVDGRPGVARRGRPAGPVQPGHQAEPGDHHVGGVVELGDDIADRLDGVL